MFVILGAEDLHRQSVHASRFTDPRWTAQHQMRHARRLISNIHQLTDKRFVPNNVFQFSRTVFLEPSCVLHLAIAELRHTPADSGLILFSLLFGTKMILSRNHAVGQQLDTQRECGIFHAKNKKIADFFYLSFRVCCPS